MEYENLKIFTICKYESNKIKSLIENLPIYSSISTDIYNTNSNLVLLDNFIGELYDDFKDIIPEYKFCNFIEYLLKENDKPDILHFGKLLSSDLIYYSIINIEDPNIFNKIIDKYSNIFISNYTIPLDPKTKLTISNEKFNISYLIFKWIVVNNTNNNCDQITLDYMKIQKIISHLSQSNYFCLTMIYKFNFIPNTKNLSKYIEDNITCKTSINIEQIKKDEKKNFFKLYLYVWFKNFIEQNKFEDFNEILLKLYCGAHLEILELINVIKPNLIKLDLIMLQKIIYYGRFEVFEFIFFNIPHVILDLLSKSNPFDIVGLNDISYIDDIWNGQLYYENEKDNKFIGKRDHVKLIDLIFAICAEKNYHHVQWTWKIKKDWVNLALEYKSDIIGQDYYYFISYDELLKLLKLSFDIKNKESIQQHIDLFGKKATWNWITENSNENFLDLFFN